MGFIKIDYKFWIDRDDTAVYLDWWPNCESYEKLRG